MKDLVYVVYLSELRLVQEIGYKMGWFGSSIEIQLVPLRVAALWPGSNPSSSAIILYTGRVNYRE
jgi:hypothetical protein